MLWMANGLDDNFDNEIVATLEQLFQECRMRDMAAEKKEKRELQRALDEQRAPASGGVTTSQSDHDVGSIDGYLRQRNAKEDHSSECEESL